MYHPVLGRYQSEIPVAQVLATPLQSDPAKLRAAHPHLHPMPLANVQTKTKHNDALLPLLRQHHAQQLSGRKHELIRDLALGQVVLVRRKLCVSDGGENTSKAARVQQVLGVVVEIKNQFNDPLTCVVRLRQILLGTGVEMAVRVVGYIA